MAATVFDKPMFPGAKFIVSEITVTNTSGAYTRTVENDKITAHMSAARMEVEDAYVIRGKVTITCANGSYTISCPEVVGQTDIKIFFLKTVDDQQTVTSAEFDVLNNRITAIENTEINNSITIPVNGWTLDSETGEYVYEWSNSAVTTACSVDVEFLESENDIDIDSITFEKGTGKITFTVEYLPNYAVPVNVRITNARASDIANLTGEDIATDAISGASNVDEALVAMTTYTESEQVIGTWIDGKPLYRKSKVIRNVSTVTNIAMELSNIDLFVNVSMMIRDSTSSHNWRPIPWTFNGEMAAWSGGFYISSSGTLNMQLGTSLDDADTAVVIIEYTKTTDTATITT